jgi:hypothetical protein
LFDFEAVDDVTPSDEGQFLVLRQNVSFKQLDSMPFPTFAAPTVAFKDQNAAYKDDDTENIASALAIAGCHGRIDNIV